MKYTLVHSAFLSNGEFPTKVANFFYEDDQDIDSCLEDIFRRSQNIEGSWSKGRYITWKGDTLKNSDYNENMEMLVTLKEHKETGYLMGLRSTSVGDHVVVDGNIYKCDNFGWKKVDKVEGDYR